MIEIHRLHTLNNEIIMQMTEGKNILCQAKAISKLDGTAEIISIGNDSYDLGKALLNAIDLMGIKDVVCYDKNMDKLLRALRFRFENDTYFLDLTNYFCSNC